MQTRPRLVEEVSTTTLLRDALDEAKHLIQIEAELAKAEATRQVKTFATAALVAWIGGALGTIAIAMVAVALLLAVGATPTVALVIAAAFGLVAVIAGYLAKRRLPTEPFARTRHRLEHDFRELREHVA